MSVIVMILMFSVIDRDRFIRLVNMLGWNQKGTSSTILHRLSKPLSSRWLDIIQNYDTNDWIVWFENLFNARTWRTERCVCLVWLVGSSPSACAHRTSPHERNYSPKEIQTTRMTGRPRFCLDSPLKRKILWLSSSLNEIRVYIRDFFAIVDTGSVFSTPNLGLPPIAIKFIFSRSNNRSARKKIDL